MNYQDIENIIVEQIKLIKELNNEECNVELNEQTAIYAEGADLDSKDIVELILRLDEKFNMNLIEKVDFNISVIKNIGSFAGTVQAVFEECKDDL